MEPRSDDDIVTALRADADSFTEEVADFDEAVLYNAVLARLGIAVTSEDSGPTLVGP
jgi:hypothetical protein